jgi:hypothetical protein
MAPDIEPLPADAAAPVSQASAFDQLMARQHQITQAFKSVRKLLEDIADEEPAPVPDSTPPRSDFRHGGPKCCRPA